MDMSFLPRIQLRPNPWVVEVFALGTSVLIAITLFHSSQLGRIVRAQRNSGKWLLVNVKLSYFDVWSAELVDDSI